MEQKQGAYLFRKTLLKTKVFSFVYILLGGVLTGFFSLGIILTLMEKGNAAQEDLIICSVILLPSLFLLYKGIQKNRLLRIARYYDLFFAGNPGNVVDIEHLAAVSNKPVNKIEKELNSLFQKHFFDNCSLRMETPISVFLNNVEDKKTNVQYIVCPNCGASNQILLGHPTTCEYCGSPIIADNDS